MPVLGLKGPTRVQFRLVIGNDDEGKPVFRTRSFGRITPNATDEEIYDIGEKMMSLQKHQVFNVNRIDHKELVKED
ncbi:DUF1659 domain-containing protein [Natranaerobius thermophilus]|uniref:DUF1659 domain-containing protein n=1 Tax=Natranaerobius thermophilus (strain ATCC BAA-1301 / DSM 18059 / JW/NM-WN-LF) TaxID=457570 RepID=B2A1R0_NATTJ|nr:DUF1659 domain-containing protein [Natranaerobius thermophilus]ACB86107.1 protein of unknown function DUF1659 [Natranaerobius thermophilus JW/NM-WN-LF]